jgi:DNA repair exonuclease SbcCD nuclease subunit
VWRSACASNLKGGGDIARVLHIADLHLDRAFKGLSFQGCDGEKRRQLLRRALERAVDTALERGADLLTVGGDLFEHEHVTSDTVAFITRQLARARCQVIVVSGNHDFAHAASPYRTARWPVNVLLRLDPTPIPVEVAGAVVWALGYAGPEVDSSVLEQVPPEIGAATKLLLVHGVDASATTAEPGRIALDPGRARELGLDHVLLGHIHAGRVGEVLSNPGSPVPLDPAETSGNHGALWIETSGREVKVEAVPLDLCRFVTVSVDVAGIGDSSALEDELRRNLASLDGASRALVACRLFGRRASSLRIDPAVLAQQLTGDAMGVSVADATEPEIDLAELAREPNARGRALHSLLASDRPEAAEAARLVAEAFENELRLPA